MLAVSRSQQPWGLLPDPACSSWCRPGSPSPNPAACAAALGLRPDIAAFTSPSAGLPSRDTCLRAAPEAARRRVPWRLPSATAGDGSGMRSAVMPVLEEASDEQQRERLQATRDLKWALEDPEAAAASELRRHHREAVDMSRAGDPEMALACLQSLLVRDETRCRRSVTAQSRDRERLVIRRTLPRASTMTSTLHAHLCRRSIRTRAT